MGRKRTSIAGIHTKKLDQQLRRTKGTRPKERLSVLKIASTGLYTLQMMAHAVGRARSVMQQYGSISSTTQALTPSWSAKVYGRKTNNGYLTILPLFNPNTAIVSSPLQRSHYRCKAGRDSWAIFFNTAAATAHALKTASAAPTVPPRIAVFGFNEREYHTQRV